MGFSRTLRKALAMVSCLAVLASSFEPAAAALVFSGADLVSGGMEQAPLSETKVAEFQKYLLQNRSSTGTSLLLEAGLSGGYRELDHARLLGGKVAFTGAAPHAFSYGQAMYDGNIAVLDFASSGSGRYTYEAPYYCDLLVSSLAKFAKAGNNVCLPSYASFQSEYAKDPERTYVNVMKTSEAASADFSRYGMVVFPDIVLGRHSEILEDFGSGGIAKLKAFAQNGGLAYFSSKSLVLADKMGLTDRVVDEETLVKHHENQGRITIVPGDGSAGAPDFFTQVLNGGLYEGKDYSASSGSGYYDYLLGSYFVRPENDPSVVPVRSFDVAHDANYYFQDLSTMEDAPLDAESAVAAFYKPYGQGLVVYNGGNSLFSPLTGSHNLFRNHFLNAAHLSFLREAYARAKVVQKSNPSLRPNLVPALEKNLEFEYSMDATNAYDGSLSGLRATATLAPGGISPDSELPAGCSYDAGTRTVSCERASLASGETWSVSFKIRVDEPSFTQAGLGIVVARSRLAYGNSRGAEIDQNLGAQTVDAAESANIRASLNIDPAGYYPLPGAGVYVDQVVNAENKAATEAVDAQYAVSVPLLSPIFDESDQSRLVSRLVFSKDLHNSLYNPDTKTGFYPFKDEGACAVTDHVLSDRCKDYVIPALASGSGYRYVDNYDEPVSRQGTDADEAWANVNTGGLSPELGKGIVRQTFIPDAGALFTRASPRRMAFQYPAKKELLFARQDVYFYDNPAYPLPKGVTSASQFLSLDKRSECAKEDGSYGYPQGVVAGKYPNALACGASGTSWVSEKIDFDQLPEGMEKSTYLYPISPENGISGPEMLEGFDADGNYVGQADEAGNRSEAYPVKYVRGTYAAFDLPARSTPKGGYIEITLPEGTDPTGAYVTADHLAITKTVTEGRTVRAYFYRGKLPNEQALKSPVGVALAGVDRDFPGVAARIYSLTYDLSQASPERYDLEREIPVSFAARGFLEMPAVKMKFSLPRRKRIAAADVSGLGLTDGQKAVLFSVPEYYEGALAFKAADSAALDSAMDRAGVSGSARSALSALFAATPAESYLRKYENLEPMVRFGTYIQEMAFHRTVWGVVEDHPVRDPGIMADSAMFGSVGTVGISPVPFREYLTTGESQVTPLATENSRVDYKDIFGRSFAAPMRSVVPEAAPLPPPLRNFMMNTTYEMYGSDGVRRDFWDGETELEVRQNVKVYDNYSKFFDPTVCSDNPSSPEYGKCWDGKGSATTGYAGQTAYRLSDKVLDPTDLFWTGDIRLFDTKAQRDAFQAELQGRLTASGLTSYSPPELRRAQDGRGSVSLAEGESVDDSARNYSPEVERYYPEGYAGNSMWNLTHFDYDDGYYAKGYPYHLDNRLPNASESLSLPQNAITIPVSRGTGYKMKYFAEERPYLQYEIANDGSVEHDATPYSSWKYAGKKGWWPENLQNRDDTLLAGQASVNEVPYAWTAPGQYLKPALVSPSDFAVSAPSNNIYSCLFNPGTLNDVPGKYAFKPNVLANNVIPMIPWVRKGNADMLSSYFCNAGDYSGKYSDPDNLSRVNNATETEAGFWLQFAANLRGGAKEGLNVLSRLSAIPGTLYEGDAKAVEGGRFVYWNPGLGPNAYEIVDNPASVVKTVNSAVTADKELIPYALKNRNTDAYLLYTVKDPGETFTDIRGRETARPWKGGTYADSRGNGNYASSVYVGASRNGAATESLLDPGESSLVRVDIGNNSGYDWAMLGSGARVETDAGQFSTYVDGGIDFAMSGSRALNANDLLSNVARNVLLPLRYNFLKLDIPEEIRPYVTVAPSDANALVTGTFFDFDSVNVTTIRDGFKGVYFLDLSVSPSIPDALRGKAYSIKASLDGASFRRLPGVDGKDPVGWPEEIGLPDVRFAVADSGGAAFYRSGYSTGVSLSVDYASGFAFDSAHEITADAVDALRLAAGDGTNKHRRLREFMENLTSSGYAVRTMPAAEEASASGTRLSLDFSAAGINEFPYLTATGAIVPKTYVLVHLKRDALSDGEHAVENSSSVSYANFAGKAKVSKNDVPLKGYAQGPKLEISYRSALVGAAADDVLDIQKLAEGENTVEVKLFLENVGTDVAFDPTIKVDVGDGVTVDPGLTGHASISGNLVTIRNLYSLSGALGAEGEAVGPGITNYFPIYLTYSGAYREEPVELVRSASYEFTPYDPALPSLTGSYSTGFSLGFVQTSASAQRQGADRTALTLSGNTVGVFWDASVDGSPLLSKATQTGSEVLASGFRADPLVPHSASASSFYRTRGGAFRPIASFSLPREAEAATLVLESRDSSGPDDAFAFRTNALGKYGYGLSWAASQGASAFSGSQALGDSGSALVALSGSDILLPLDLSVSVTDGSGSVVKTFAQSFPAAGARVMGAAAARFGDLVRVSFSTNFLRGTCYDVYRDGSLAAPCRETGTGTLSYVDASADPLSDHAYKITVYRRSDASASVSADAIYLSSPDLSAIPLKILSSAELREPISFGKVKDFLRDYLVDETLVRYAVRMRANAPYVVQYADDGDSEIRYASGQTVYAGAGWDLKLDKPAAMTGALPQLSGYVPTGGVEAGDPVTAFSFENFNLVILKNVWKKPARVASSHSGELSVIPECDDVSGGGKTCWFYDVNKVGIYTKRFSKFVLYDAASGGPTQLNRDNCPSGDRSPSYYDGTCGAAPKPSGGGGGGGGGISAPSVAETVAVPSSANPGLSKEAKATIRARYFVPLRAAVARRPGGVQGAIRACDFVSEALAAAIRSGRLDAQRIGIVSYLAEEFALLRKTLRSLPAYGK